MDDDDEQRQEIEREFRTLEQDATAFSQRLSLFNPLLLLQQSRARRDVETEREGRVKKGRGTLQRQR